MQIKKAMALLIIGLITLTACDQTSDNINKVTSIPESELSANQDNDSVVIRPTATLALEDNTVSVADLSPTPLPQQNNLGVGEARTIANATDVAYQPTPREEVVFDDFPVNITFSEFYDGFNMRTGLVLSDKLVALDGQNVVMEGYVAPPLKPKLDFFVLTSIPLASCPFCSTAADWPDDIALIYLTEEEVVYTPYPVRISGRMEIGTSVDAETGMVSLVRIYAEKMEVMD